MIGNKIDLSNLRAVNTNEAILLAKQYNIAFIETSALKAVNVDLAFQKIVQG